MIEIRCDRCGKLVAVGRERMDVPRRIEFHAEISGFIRESAQLCDDCADWLMEEAMRYAKPRPDEALKEMVEEGKDDRDA